MAFEDLLDSSKYEVPIKARPSITINGVNLRIYGFELTGLPDILLPPTRQRTTTLTGRHGQLSFGDLYENWNFSVEGQIVGQNLEDVVKKQHQLLRFLDIERDQDFAIGEQNYSGLRFELSGAPLFASKGSVDVTQNGKSISGTGTLFTAYAKPGATFEVDGDSTIYTIESVQSDTGLNVTPAISRASGSILSYRIERRRYLLVSYDGSSSISPITDRGFNKQGGVGDIVRLGYNFTFGFYTVYPYWVGDTFTRTFSGMASEDIKTLEYIGNAPSPPVYFIQGVADNPSITAGKTVLQATCDGKVSGTGVKGELITPFVGQLWGTSAVGTQKVDYVPIETTSSFGAHVSNSGQDYLIYPNLKLNKERLSGFMSCKLPTHSNTPVSQELITFYLDTDNYLEINWKLDGDVFLELKDNGGATKVPQTDYQGSLATAGYHTIGFWYDSAGVLDEKDGHTYYAKVLIDGEIAWSTKDGTDCPEFTNSLTNLQIKADYYDGAMPGLIL